MKTLPKFITETEKGNLMVRTKAGDLEMKKLTIKEYARIQNTSEHTNNIFDTNIELARCRLVEPISTEELEKMLGSVLSAFIVAGAELNEFDGKVVKMKDERVKVTHNKINYIFEEKSIGDLKQSGANTISENKISYNQIRLSLVEPIITEEEFSKLPESLYSGFKEAIGMLYYEGLGPE